MDMTKGVYMKFLLIFAVLSFSRFGLTNDIYQESFKLADGGEINFSKLKDQSFLIVNIATKCGLTGQLEGLQSLHKKYSKRGFSVIGVPSNEFAGQTPEGNKKVAEFCRLKYGTNFPITTKQIITGDKKINLYKKLIAASESKKEIQWNFTKFLIGKDGKLIQRFEPSVAPESATIVKAIEGSLK